MQAIPVIRYLAALLGQRIDHARSQEPSRGASAVEWVVISAILVAIALGIGLAISTALNNKANTISQDIEGAGG